MRIAHCPQCGGNVQVTSSGTCPLGHALAHIPASAEAGTESAPQSAAAGSSLFGLGAHRAAELRPVVAATPKERTPVPAAVVIVLLLLAVFLGAGAFFGYQMVRPNPDKVIAKAAATTRAITSSTYNITLTITDASKKPAVFRGSGSSTPQGSSVVGTMQAGKTSIRIEERLVGGKLYVRTDSDVGWLVVPVTMPESSIADGKLAPVDYTAYLRTLNAKVQASGVEAIDGAQCLKVTSTRPVSDLLKDDAAGAENGDFAKAARALKGAVARVEIWIDQKTGRPVKELVVMTTAKPQMAARAEIEFTSFNPTAVVVAPPKAELASAIAKESAEKRAAAARLAKRLRAAKSRSAAERHAQQIELSRQDQLLQEYASQGVKASKTKQDGMQQLMWGDGTSLWVDSSTMPGYDIFGAP